MNDHPQSKPPGRSIWIQRLLIILFGLALLGTTAGLWDLWGPDETRYTQIARELSLRADRFKLTEFGIPYDQKPPFPFWIFAVVLRATGGEVIAGWLRAPAVFAAILSALIIHSLGLRLFNARTGLLAALIWLTTAQVIEEAHAVKLDMMYTAWLLVALYPWLTRERGRPLPWGGAALLWIALAGAFFTKGPLAILIVLIVVVAEGWNLRSCRVCLDARAPQGLLLLGLLIYGWMRYQEQVWGADFVETQVEDATWDRLWGGTHREAPWYYLTRLPFSIFLPWGLLLIPVGVLLWLRRKELTPALADLTAWALIPLIVMSLAAGKRHAYLLPILPPMVLLVAWYLDGVIAEGRVFPRIGRALAGLAWVIGGVLTLAGLALVLFGRDPELPLQVNPVPAMGAALGGGIIFSIGWAAWRRREGRPWPLTLRVVAVSAILALVNMAVVNPGLNVHNSSRAFSRWFERHMAGEGTALVAGAIDRAARAEYHVYGKYTIVPMDDHPEDFAPGADLPAHLLARKGDAEDLEPVLALAGYTIAARRVVNEDLLVIFHREG